MAIQELRDYCKAPGKEHISIYIMPKSLPNPMFDHLLESSFRDDHNTWSNLGFGEETTQIVLFEVYFHASYLELYVTSVYLARVQ